MMNEFLLLSAEGEKRRDQILQLAKRQALDRVRAAARRRRNIAGLAMVALGLSLAIRFGYRQYSKLQLAKNEPHRVDIPKTEPTKAQIVIHLAATIKPQPQITIGRIHTEPGFAQQFIIKSQIPNWPRLNDDQLLLELTATGKPAGLIWIDGRQRLWMPD